MVNQNISNQDISITLPFKIHFLAIEELLKKELLGLVINKKNSVGKKRNYLKILNLQIERCPNESYNLNLILKLEILTLLYKNKIIQVSVKSNLELDVKTQRLYINSYSIDNIKGNKLTNHLIKSLGNKLIYKKLIEKLTIDLTPIIKSKLNLINSKLAAQYKIKSGISLIGNIASFTITKFEIRDSELWIFVNSQGWCIIDIEKFDMD